jgi:hypothetical protein
MNGKDKKKTRESNFLMGRTAFTEVKMRRSYRYSRDVLKKKEKDIEKGKGKGKGRGKG